MIVLIDYNSACVIVTPEDSVTYTVGNRSAHYSGATLHLAAALIAMHPKRAITVIKMLRQAFSLDLLEAKDLFDCATRTLPILESSIASYESVYQFRNNLAQQQVSLLKN